MCFYNIEAVIPSQQQSTFHFKLWLLLTVQNWVLDFGRPFFALIVSDLFPLTRPHFGELINISGMILSHTVLSYVYVFMNDMLPAM